MELLKLTVKDEDKLFRSLFNESKIHVMPRKLSYELLPRK